MPICQRNLFLAAVGLAAGIVLALGVVTAASAAPGDDRCRAVDMDGLTGCGNASVPQVAEVGHGVDALARLAEVVAETPDPGSVRSLGRLFDAKVN